MQSVKKHSIVHSSVGSNPVRGFEVWIFGGFGWVRSSSLVDEPGFERVRSSGFLDLSLDSAHLWLNRFEVRAFGGVQMGSKFGVS